MRTTRTIRRAAILAGVALPLVFAIDGAIGTDRAAVVRAVQSAPLSSPRTADAAPTPLADALAGARYRLPARDRETYGRAFAALDRGDWTAARTALDGTTDRRLAGHLLASHYLTQGADPSYTDLRSWIDLYRDLPQAAEIYRLAQATQPRGATPLPEPLSRVIVVEAPPDPDSPGWNEPKTAAGSRAQARFFMADDKGALADALNAIRTLGNRASSAHWVAGLAAWRLGQLEEASRHFAALAGTDRAAGWLQAAGAYWAGRVDEQRGVAASASKWFGNASRFPTTFYGMLAMRKLGLDIARQVSAESLSTGQLDLLAETPAGYRAIALLEIGRRDLAAKELERIDPTGNPKLAEAIVITAEAAKLGELSPSLAQRIAGPADESNDDFPIPAWRPSGGFRIDPALVFAVARQESGFDPKAVSAAGAAGLMQIMPGTAHTLAPLHKASLFDPATNLDLGQRYLSALMRDPNVGENLLLLAVAYNRGTGNPEQFRKMLDHGDPLMAVESIPAAKTRNFIKRILANYWVYKSRIGGDTTSLTDLANGQWPVYRWRSTEGDILDSLDPNFD